MSNNMLRNKQGNLSKVKYYLPKSRQTHNDSNQQSHLLPSQNILRKKSNTNAHTRSMDEHA